MVAVPFDSLLTVQSALRCTPDLQQKAVALSGVLGQLTREDDALALRILWERFEMDSDSVYGLAAVIATVTHCRDHFDLSLLLSLRPCPHIVCAD